MPITKEQAGVLRLLAENRSSSAYLAGGIIAARESGRFSADIDYFHDSPDETLSTFAMDEHLLIANGYEIHVEVKKPGFVRAIVQRDDVVLRLDWAHEAAWHFFSPIENPDVGFELHWADAATNKVLAMASRAEIRDGFDLLYWNKSHLSLGALIWAAAGKDLGLSPGFILDELRRNARISPDDLALLNTVTPIDAQRFGVEFREATRQADELLQALPPETIGSLFLGPDGAVIEPVPAHPETLTRLVAPSKGGIVPRAI